MSTLTDRYVYATTKTVHGDGREELARELRGEIDEMVAARTDQGEPADAAERSALLELGDPDRLAASYAGRPLQLIGPAYFLAWKRLLILLLTWVPATVGIIVAVGGLLDGDPAGGAVGDGVSTAIELAIQVVFWTTLTFALIDRYASAADAPKWSLDDLPELPPPARPPLHETAGAVAGSAVAAGLLVWQELRGVLETSSGERVPLIDSALWSTWIPVIIAALAAEAVFAILAYRRGGWSFPLAAGNAAAQLAFAIPAIWLLVTDTLLDPRFVAEVDWLQEGNHLHSTSLVVAAVVAVIALADIAGKLRAAMRARSSRRAAA